MSEMTADTERRVHTNTQELSQYARAWVPLVGSHPALSWKLLHHFDLTGKADMHKRKSFLKACFDRDELLLLALWNCAKITLGRV